MTAEHAHRDFIVVGVDETPAAVVAARWAAAEADRRHKALRLVQAYCLPASAGYPDYNPYPDDLRSVLAEEAEQSLEQLAGELRRAHPQLEISTRAVYDTAVPALQKESQHALLTVVGSGNPSRFSGVLLGSVALAMASTNPAPVAVIHRDQTHFQTGPVVVGVDGSPTSDAAVAFAFEEAAERGTDLVAVHAWSDTFISGSSQLQSVLIDPARIDEEERVLLSERLAGWREKYPDVTVEQVVANGRSVNTLLHYGAKAQLVVVGSHGRGGFTGMLLGSTSHSLIIHCACPVIVVRPETAG